MQPLLLLVFCIHHAGVALPDNTVPYCVAQVCTLGEVACIQFGVTESAEHHTQNTPISSIRLYRMADIPPCPKDQDRRWTKNGRGRAGDM
jgi:hypothetical protein